MDKLMLMNEQINGIVWGKYMIFFLLFTGFWLMIRTKFLPFTHAKLIMRKTLGSLGRNAAGDGVTPFQAVATALAGTLGVGSVVSVTTALTMGGPGALLWMCVSAIFGMMTKYAEVVLAIHYRSKHPDGTYIGGPMTTLENGCHMGFLGILFAVLCIFASFGIGNVTPANTIAHTITSYISIPSWILGVIMAAFIAWIIFGKGNLIMRFNEITIPVISVLYIAACLYLIFLHADQLPHALQLVWEDAMRPMAGIGGLGGFAIAGPCISVFPEAYFPMKRGWEAHRSPMPAFLMPMQSSRGSGESLRCSSIRLSSVRLPV
ncbi:MAG: alanine/glycine:cation symporter family protein [[Clostridium] innocuum]